MIEVTYQVQNLSRGALADAPDRFAAFAGSFHPVGEELPRGRSYCNSLVTICCVLLAWARALMPVWVRISYFDMSEVAEA
jgi:hypothetical protein